MPGTKVLYETVRDSPGSCLGEGTAAEKQLRASDVRGVDNGGMECAPGGGLNDYPDGSVDRTGPVRILTDGIERTVPAGTDVEITRGNSMTIYPGLYHLFMPKPRSGDLIVGEVSSVNDDRTDNYFEEERPRFIPVEEDCNMLFPLCNEYTECFFSSRHQK